MPESETTYLIILYFTLIRSHGRIGDRNGNVKPIYA
jgi:hypothetical protein